MLLRQSTASQEVLLGPFLDSTDGDTAETGLTIANTDIKLWKEGATTEANKNSGGATHIAGGRYYAVLDATDTNTLGKLEINIHVAGALAVRREYMVVPSVVYDSLVLGSDTLTVDVIQWLGTAVATPTVAGVPEVDLTHMEGVTQSVTDLKDFADAGYDPATNKVQGVVLVDTTTTNTDMRGTDSALLAASAPTNFGDMSITATTGLVDITQAAADKAWTTAARTVTAATNITSDASAITMSSAGVVGTVNLVNTTTTNTDMRGTDSAFLAASAPTNFSDMSITVTTGLVDITQTAADKVWATTARTLTDGIQKNAAFSNFEFLMVLTSDHVTPATGLTVTGQRSIDGGAFTAVSGAIAEVSNGIYQFDALAADTNGDVITWRFSSATADDTFVTVTTS